MSFSPSRRVVLIEGLEPRALFSVDWGATAELIRQNLAVAEFPAVTGAGQTIAIIDSGIAYNHPALGGGFGPGFKVIGGYDFADDDADPLDVSGHGTEVAGTIGASEFVADGSTYRGIAPGAKLVALRVDGGDGYVPDQRVEAAFRWIIDHPAFNISVVNISYGDGHFDTPDVSAVYGDEIAVLAARGVTIVAAAGNGGVPDGPGIDGPAADPNVIAVGAVSAFNVISDFSERGALTAILAPGEDVFTTFRTGGFASVAGTSFSSPIVAGSIALAKSIDPTLTLKDIRAALSASGTITQDGDDEVGATTTARYPRLDLYNYLKITQARAAAPDEDAALFGKAGNNNALVVDRFGVTHFVYFDSVAKTLQYATRSASGAWSTLQTIDTSAPNLGIYVSMVVDSFGRPAVAYFDGNAGDLRYAEFDGLEWSVTTIDSTQSVGLYPSMTLDAAGKPAISYYRKTSGDLRVARRLTDIWTVTNVDTTDDIGRSTTIALDPNGKLGIAYEDSTRGTLRLVRETATSWNRTTVDSTLHGVSFMSLAFDAIGRPAVSYYDASPADLKFARQSPAGVWSYTTLATRGAVGLYTSLYFDAGGLPNILYYDRRAAAAYRVAARANGTFATTLLAADSGKFITSAEDVTTGTRAYSAFDLGTSQLGVATVA